MTFNRSKIFAGPWMILNYLKYTLIKHITFAVRYGCKRLLDYNVIYIHTFINIIDFIWIISILYIIFLIYSF